MSMAVGGGKGNAIADMNVTPMVDIMLVILIIFMVITPLLQKGVSVDLAKTKIRAKCARLTGTTRSWLRLPAMPRSG